jgi:hypothetical protein
MMFQEGNNSWVIGDLENPQSPVDIEAGKNYIATCWPRMTSSFYGKELLLDHLI